jgi:hypothetical protein
MSYEQVRAVKPESAMLLDQWAFLHPGEISYRLVVAYTFSLKHRRETQERECITTIVFES